MVDKLVKNDDIENLKKIVGDLSPVELNKLVEISNSTELKNIVVEIDAFQSMWQKIMDVIEKE